MSKKLISLLLSLLLVLGAVGVPVGATGDPAPQTVTFLFRDIHNPSSNFTKDLTAEVGSVYMLLFERAGTPTLTGYDFKGWYKSSDTTNKTPIANDALVEAPSGAAKQVILYAKWEPKKYTLTMNLGYDNKTDSKTVTYGEEYGLADPTRTNYTFVGWFTSASGGTKITADTKVATANNHTVYARWTQDTKEVTLDFNGGTYNGNTTLKINVPVGNTYASALSRYVPQKEGATHVGWTTDTNGNNDLGTDTTASKTDSISNLYAKWSNIEYTVKLNTSGGSALNTDEFKITYDQAYGDAGGSVLNQKPTRDGYDFLGWYTASGDTGKQIADANGTTIDTTTKYSELKVQTLYAHWKAKAYQITYDYAFPTPAACAWKGPDDQYTTTAPTTTPTPSPVTYNSTYPALPTPAPSEVPYYSEGSEKKYTFEGWYAKDKDVIYHTNPPLNETYEAIKDGTNGDIYTLTDAQGQTLYARWGYEIEFFANTGAAGEKSIGTLKCVTGKAYDVEKMPKEPTRAGYTFDGWYAGREDSAAKVELNVFKVADAMNKKLYAHWKNASYQVTLDPNGGPSVSPTEITVTYNENYTALPTPADRKGYTFAGWYTEKDGGDKVETNTKVQRTETHTLYAHWTPKPASLTIDYQLPVDFVDTDKKYPPLTGKLDIGQELSVAGLPAAPASFEYGDPKVKFDFDDWYTTANDKDPNNKGRQVNRQTALTADMVDNDLKITLYARWSMPVGFCNNYDGKATETTRPDSAPDFVIGSVYGSKLPAPTRTGYTFKGWFTKPGEDGVQKTSTDVAEMGVTRLYAHWTTSEYVVYLDPTDGAFSEEQKIRSKEFNHNDPYGDFLTKYIPIPPAGHTFDGWYPEKEGGKKLTASDRVTEGGTIYAHWKADQFKVTLKLNYSGAADTVKTVDYGTELKKVLPAPEPERAGYAFLGWFKDESFATPADPEEKIAANMTLYAQWKEGKRVDLVVGGGKLPENTPSYIYVYDGGTFNKLPTPTWPGCIFGGWWTAATGGEQVTVVTPAGSNPPATLYARWTPKQVKVSFDYNGAPNLQREPKSYSIGSPYTGLPTYASWPGHEFMGWYTRSVGGEKIEASTLVSVPSDEVKELTIYAHWGYKVSFDPMEGTGEMDQQIAEMNQPYTLPTCTFTPPDGMRFGGWAIGTPDGTKQAGGSQYTVNRHLTLYATWTTAPIVITSSCTSGGSLMTEDGKANEVTVERGTDVTFVAAANTGYVLKELLVDGVNFNYTDVYTFRNVIEDHVIHAVFVPEGAPAYSTCGHGNSCPLAKYRDMTPGAWYHDGVHFCIDNVIMGGTGDGVFSPNSRATRAEVATTLWNYAGRPPIAGTGALPRTYKDVKPSAWYYQSVEWATQEGLLSGYGNGTFRPDNYITREELVSILWHHAGQPKARQTGLRFYDAWQVSSWAWDAMLWATEEGILSGRSFGYLVPKGTATRAEVATMLKNYLG